MISLFRGFLGILIVLCFSFSIGVRLEPLNDTEPMNELAAGKTRLKEKITELSSKIDGLRDYYEKHRQDLSPETNNRTHLYFFEREQQHAENLRGFLATIENTDAEKIPALLFTIALHCKDGECPNGLCVDDVEEGIVAFGPSALGPFLEQFTQFEASQKERILYLALRITPLQCPTKTLAIALDDPVYRVRAAGLKVMKKSCASESFYRGLDSLLEREAKPEFLLDLLGTVSSDDPNSGRYHAKLIQMTEKNRIPVELSLGKLCAETIPPIRRDVGEINIRFWRDVFAAHKTKRNCLIEHIFLNLDRENDLLELHDVFLAAASRRYSFGAIQGLYDRTPSPEFEDWGFNSGDDDKMLTLFQRQLGQKSIETWLRNAPETRWGERLLLRRWRGENAVPKKLQLLLEVRAPSQVIVSAATQEIKLDQPFAFTLPPRAGNFQEVDYSGTVRFDSDKLIFVIENFLVGLHPAGAGFTPEIPVDGHFETDLRWQQQEYRWILRLIPVSLTADDSGQ